MSHPINDLMGTTMDKIKQMVDVNTIVGSPITSPDGTIIIPISKVSFGFASGGSDFPTKQQTQLFGGGSGAGVSIQPIAFLAISNGDVKILQLATSSNTADKVVNMVPEVLDRISEMFKKDKDSKKERDIIS